MGITDKYTWWENNNKIIAKRFSRLRNNIISMIIKRIKSK